MTKQSINIIDTIYGEFWKVRFEIEKVAFMFLLLMKVSDLKKLTWIHVFMPFIVELIVFVITIFGVAIMDRFSQKKIKRKETSNEGLPSVKPWIIYRPENHPYQSISFMCPKLECNHAILERNDGFCSVCGQKIDWKGIASNENQCNSDK